MLLDPQMWAALTRKKAFLGSPGPIRRPHARAKRPILGQSRGSLRETSPVWGAGAGPITVLVSGPVKVWGDLRELVNLRKHGTRVPALMRAKMCAIRGTRQIGASDAYRCSHFIQFSTIPRAARSPPEAGRSLTRAGLSFDVVDLECIAAAREDLNGISPWLQVAEVHGTRIGRQPLLPD